MFNRVFLGVIALLALVFQASAQSTYGTILGSVTDTSGAIMPNASVEITNTDENTSHKVLTNSTGNYELSNSQPAHYQITVSAPGFSTFTATGLTLAARQILRADAVMQVGQAAQSVTVSESENGVIATDTQAIQSGFNSKDLLELPANTRANGSTSPYQLIQVLPGVTSDQSKPANLSIQGGIPSQTQYSLDGISVTNVGGNSPLTEAFPSSESIAEIKVQGVGNQAEYGQVGDITTISKSGTNQFHGDLFWYAQNRALNALGFGQQSKPQLVANDFGASAGGPVVIPHLYNGHDKTFFYGTYEGFQYPRGETIQNSVPTQLERGGDFTQEGAAPNDPTTGLPFPGNVIPSTRISPVASGFLALYPLPNSGNLNKSSANNWISNKNNNYSSNQYDIRVDHYLTSTQSFFARWTWKNIDSLQPQNLSVPTETIGDKYKLFVVSHNWALKPNLLNEARFGFTLNNGSQALPYDGAKFTNGLGLVGIGPTFPFNGLPDVSISNYQELNTDRGNTTTINHTYQFTDNLTWHRGNHTLKAGFDYRRIRAVSALGFTNGDNYGGYNFDGTFTGLSFADFLLGLPISTELDNITSDNDGRSNHYNAYLQDSWHVNSRLTLEYGLRWEFHPGYIDAHGNIGNFDPSIAKSGAVIYSDGAASTLAPTYLQSFNACPTLGSTVGPAMNGAPCTPVLTASQAGYPNYLRNAPQRFVPRFGFAYRLPGDKTVVRGGFNVFNTEVLGSIYYALTGTLQSNTRTYSNINAAGQPIFQWPQTQLPGLGAISPLGTAYFGTANQLNWKDPYSMQWNLSIDRDLGFQTGFRVSYIAMETRDLVWSPDLNQSYYSTQFFASQPLSNRPFPNWGTVNTRANGANANYQSMQIEINHRLKGGIAFISTYTLAKNLADNEGYANTSFAGENSGSRTMDLYNLKAEYGNVNSTPRNRWVTTATWNIPFGKGRQFGANSNRFVDAVLGGWQFNNIFTWQSGQFLSPSFSGGDPSGTGSGNFEGRAQAPDLVGNPNSGSHSAQDWFNLSAYTCPGTPNWVPGTSCLIGSAPQYGAPLGRFGNAGISTLVGPGLINLNSGLSKYFAFTERVRMKVEGSFTNSLNHLNLGLPNTSIDSSSVGLITAAASANFGGNRTGQVGARIEF
jgi:Carboxypeptidase regulatory-like domain/TonB dependent receptor